MFGIYNPNDPMGYMPEIPQKDLENMSDEDRQLLGCLYPFAFMVIMAIALAVCALVAWIF